MGTPAPPPMRLAELHDAVLEALLSGGAPPDARTLGIVLGASKTASPTHGNGSPTTSHPSPSRGNSGGTPSARTGPAPPAPPPSR